MLRSQYLLYVILDFKHIATYFWLNLTCLMFYVFSLRRHIKKSTWELFQGCDDYIKVEKSGLSRGGVVVNWRWFLWVPLEVKAASQSPHALLQWFRQNRIFNYNVSTAKLLFPAVFVLVLGPIWNSHGQNDLTKSQTTFYYSVFTELSKLSELRWAELSSWLSWDKLNWAKLS